MRSNAVIRTFLIYQRIYRPYREKLHYTWRELSRRDLFGATLSREIINVEIHTVNERTINYTFNHIIRLMNG